MGKMRAERSGKVSTELEAKGGPHPGVCEGGVRQGAHRLLD